MAKQYVPPKINIIDEDPNESNRGNVGLPFGLCKKYGIAIENGWTPRDAWNALKDKTGITPDKAYKDLQKEENKKRADAKQKFEENEERKVNIEDEKKAQKIKKLFETKAFKTINKATKAKIEKALSKLSVQQVNIIEEYSGYLDSFKNGSGKYQFGGQIVFNQNSEGTGLDKELGFDFEACTFFHEYGHFIDNTVGRRTQGLYLAEDSSTVDVKEDALSAFNKVIEEGGGINKIQNFNRLSRETVQDFYKGLAKVTGKDQVWQYKSLKEFGYIDEPRKPFRTPEQAKALYGENSYLYKVAIEAQKTYEENYQKWQLAEADGSNAAAKEKKEQYTKELYAHNEPIENKIHSCDILTDFFGLYTNNRINPYKNGYWGHKGTYNKDHNVQSEMWAEYFSYKMTNNEFGINLMKKFFPNSYKAFEDKYNKLLP